MGAGKSWGAGRGPWRGASTAHSNQNPELTVTARPFRRGGERAPPLRFINPTPAAEAKLLGEKVARNAAFREVRVQAIKRRLDEGEALGSRAAAGRGRAEGGGSDTQTRDGRDSGSCAAAELASGAGGGRGRGRHGRASAAAGGVDRRVGQTDDLSLKDGRLRENKLIIAPPHPEDPQRGGGSGDTHGSRQRQRQWQERGQQYEQWGRLRGP